MEKAGLIELGATKVKLIIAQIVGGGFHKVVQTYEEIVRCDEEIYEKNALGGMKISECLRILEFYKEICQKQNITKIYGYTSSIFLNIKNFKTFFDEIYRTTGFVFNNFSDDEIAKSLFNGLAGTVDATKGAAFYVNEHNSYIISFSKRNLYEIYVLPLGANLLSYIFKEHIEEAPIDVVKKMVAYAKQEINKLNIDFSMHEEMNFIGGGDVFLSLSKLVRKMTRYPLDMDNNYHCKASDILKAFDMVKDFGFDKTKKIGGISDERLDNIIAGFSIIQAFTEKFEVPEYVISTRSLAENTMATKVVKEEVFDFNKFDMLDLCLMNHRYHFPVENSNIEYVYKLVQTLFKQLAVVHKLEKRDAKPLKVATQLYDCGKRIATENHSKYSKEIILGSNLYGITHRELVIAAFACQCQNFENFSLSEWIKYKDVVNEGDLDIARKLGSVLCIATALDVTGLGRVKSVECDLLGDVVIIKVDSPKEVDISYEKLEAEKIAPYFKKIYGKTYTIM